MRRLWFTVLVACILVASVSMYAHLLRRQADTLVRNTYELSLSTSKPTLTELQHRYGRQLHLDGCDPNLGCSYTVTFSNRRLAALHIFRFAEITSSFGVRDGAVLDNMISYRVTDGTHFDVTAHVQIEYCNGCDNLSVDPWTGAAPSSSNGIVEIGSASSQEWKRKLLSFDTSCVARLRGCRTLAELLPTVWQQTASRTIGCRLPSHEGFVRPPSWDWTKVAESVPCNAPAQQKVRCLCGLATFCIGQMCGISSHFDLDDKLDVVLRDKRGNALETKRVSDQDTGFCFEGRRSGKYQIAFVTYNKGIARLSTVYPIIYESKREKYWHIYTIQPHCPKPD